MKPVLELNELSIVASEFNLQIYPKGTPLYSVKNPPKIILPSDCSTKSWGEKNDEDALNPTEVLKVVIGTPLDVTLTKPFADTELYELKSPAIKYVPPESCLILCICAKLSNPVLVKKV